jgi:hypothetical protein
MRTVLARNDRCGLSHGGVAFPAPCGETPSLPERAILFRYQNSEPHLLGDESGLPPC